MLQYFSPCINLLFMLQIILSIFVRQSVILRMLDINRSSTRKGYSISLKIRERYIFVSPVQCRLEGRRVSGDFERQWHETFYPLMLFKKTFNLLWAPWFMGWSLTLIPAAYCFILSERLNAQKKPNYGAGLHPAPPSPSNSLLFKKFRLFFNNTMISPRKRCYFEKWLIMTKLAEIIFPINFLFNFFSSAVAKIHSFL